MSRRGQVVLRLARPDDDDALAALLQDYVAEANPQLTEATGQTIVAAGGAEARRWVLASRAAGATVLLAEDGGAALGTGTLRELEPGAAEIKRMYVRPQARGRGVGAALLDELVARARATAQVRVMLDSAPFQTAAHALYRSRGFVQRDAYPGSETPLSLQTAWLFFELALVES